MGQRSLQGRYALNNASVLRLALGLEHIFLVIPFLKYSPYHPVHLKLLHVYVCIHVVLGVKCTYDYTYVSIHKEVRENKLRYHCSIAGSILNVKTGSLTG